MTNDDLRFKIIKDESEEFKKITKEQEKKEIPVEKISNLLSEHQTNGQYKKRSKFFILIILVVFVVILLLTILYYFLKIQNNNQKQNLSNSLNEPSKDFYQIFSEIVTTSTDQLEENKISTFSTSSLINNDLLITSSEVISTSTTNLAFQSPTSNFSFLTTTNYQMSTTNLTTKKFESFSTPTFSTVTINTSSNFSTSIEKTKSTTSTKDEPSSPDKNKKIDINIKEINSQNNTSDLIYLTFPTLKIDITNLNDESFEQALISLMKIQKKAGDIYSVVFNFNNEKLNDYFIKKFFLRPSFIEEKFKENFFDNLDKDYYFLVYYTHTRKFPLLIFKIKNDLQIVPFMRLWDKESLIADLSKTMFIGLPKGQPIRNFTLAESYQNIDYKIAYFNNDYKLIWTIYKNHLIISTSLSAFKYLIENL
jgi:hypothetical protein